MANAAAAAGAQGGGGSELPGTCGMCGASPGLVIVEVNGVAITRSILCSGCFSRRVREQRAYRVTPVGGVPLVPPAEPRR